MKIVMIAEKPSVGRTYASALDLKNPTKNDGYIEGQSAWDGNYYYVTWSFGHLVTMSYPQVYDEKYKKWRFDDLPFLPSTYKYEVIKEAAKQFKIVKGLYHQSDIDKIIYAGDSGREGLYIQCLIRMLAGNNGHAKEEVLWIDSQTTDEIRKGLSRMKPLADYAAYKDAGYMRAIEDYAFGINYSRMFSCKFGREFNRTIGNTEKPKSISIGRVMTCVLAMVVQREREIQNFVATPFYRILANCSGKAEFSAEWLVDKVSKYYDSSLLYQNKGFLKQSDANGFIDELSQVPELVIESVEDKSEKKKAPLLYNLAELQNECSKRFKIDPNKTLEIAQKLYESKLTTYPRTDARYLSTAICKEIDNNLKGLQKMGYDKEYVDRILTFALYSGVENTQYCNDSKITDHYAIIPTGGGSLSGLDELEAAVYQMIVDRFVCIFLPQAEYVVTTAILKAHNGERFRINQRILVKMGYLEVIKGKTEEEEDELGGTKLSDTLKKGDKYSAVFTSEEGKTTPPKRYTSGSMILAMENAGNLIEDEELRAQIKGSGIGTSATRASILEKLGKIGYIKINKKSQVITPTPVGEAVYDIVERVIPEFLSPKMTASWEKGLAQIEEGKISSGSYKEILEKEIIKTYEKLKQIQTNDGPDYEPFESEDTGFKCPFCGSAIITSKSGYKCEKYVYKDKKSCAFCLPKKLSRDELSSFLSNGRIGPLDFTSKSGKMFKGNYVLNQTDKSIDLEFVDTTEDGEIFTSEPTGCKCPFCGDDIVTSKSGYKCKSYVYKDKNACQFSLPKKISAEELGQFISSGRIGPLDFKSKAGKPFSANYVLNKETRTIDLELPNAGDGAESFTSEPTGLTCPFCGKDVVTTPKGFKCIAYKYKEKKACGFNVSSFGGVTFTKQDVETLINTGSMGSFNFQKKSGDGTYDASMVLDKKKKSVELSFS